MNHMEHRFSTPCSAPPDQVWPLFLDLDRWPEMTESITSLRRLDTGPVQVGSEAMVKQPGLPLARWRVTEIDPGHSFIWASANAGVTTIGSHFVTPSGTGSQITLTLGLEGPLGRPMNLVFGRLARRHVTMEMEGFRRTAESAVQPH
jgi:uncharacterized membrane protein